MKKIMLFAAALAAVSLVSCGNKDKAADENADATEDTIVEETVVDEVDAEAMPGDPMDVVEAAAAGDLDEVLEADDEGETKEDKLQKAAKRASELVDRVKESDTYKEGKNEDFIACAKNLSTHISITRCTLPIIGKHIDYRVLVTNFPFRVAFAP